MKSMQGQLKPLITNGWDMDIIEIYKEGKLPILTVNMTGRCNFQCTYCHTDAGQKDPDELTASEWIRIIDESKELGNEVLWIGGKGEPLLDPAFREVVDHANQAGLTTIVNTNATLVTREMAQFLYDRNVSPEVKIVSFDEAAYDELAGVSGMLPLMRRGLKNLQEAGYGRDVIETEINRLTRIAGMILLAKPAYATLPDVFRFCRDNNFTPTISDVVASGRVVKKRNLEELKLSPEENRSVLKTGSDIMGYPLDAGFQDCSIQYGVFVQNNGNLIVDRLGMSCDVCDYSGRRTVGNLRKTTLKEGFEKIREERRKNIQEILTAYDQFRSRPRDVVAACPMALQSQQDYHSR